MPYYTFLDTEKNEEITLEMKISEMEQYKIDHPEMKQLLKPTRTVDPILLGITKPPEDFQKKVLGNIKKNNPGSTIGTGRWEV